MSSFITWQSSALLFTIACGAFACSGSDEGGSTLADTDVEGDAASDSLSGGGDTGEGADSTADAEADAFEGGADVAAGETSPSMLGVDLGSAGTFAILAKTGISSVPASAITGDLGVSPAAATYITGFSLTADATKVFSTSPQVTGKIYASNYAAPTPAKLTTAVSDMQTAFTDAASRAPKVTELGAGNIGGKTLSAGVYKWGTGLLIPTDLTLDGSATDVWIFQIAKDLTVANGTKVKLAGGAQAKNVYWQVAGAVDVGTTAHLEGIALVKTSITVRTGASVKGRLFAQTAVSLDHATVVAP